MRSIYAVFIGLLLVQPALSGEKEFIAWWKSDASAERQDVRSKYYSRRVDLNFNELDEEKKQAIKKPAHIGKDIEKVLRLYTAKNLQLLLVTPKNIMANMTTIDEQYYETKKECDRDTSWLVSMPGNSWSEIELNPYCNDFYSEDEISITLYLTGSREKPLIEIATNASECTPHLLYRWDKKAGKYLLAADKCPK